MYCEGGGRGGAERKEEAGPTRTHTKRTSERRKMGRRKIQTSKIKSSRKHTHTHTSTKYTHENEGVTNQAREWQQTGENKHTLQRERGGEKKRHEKNEGRVLRGRNNSNTEVTLTTDREERRKAKS